MNFVVVTPYFSETIDKLRECHRSVLDQVLPDEHGVVHLMVCDGHASALGAAIPTARHLLLPTNSADAGATPRGIGVALAWAWPDIDGLLFLDADNTFEPGHIAAMAARQQETGADVVTCPRRLIRPDGSLLDVCVESDGDGFNDTNCYLIMRSAWPLVGRAWVCQSRSLGLLSDREVWDAVRASGCNIARTSEATVNYTTLFAEHYTERGEQPPADARRIFMHEDKAIHVRFWA